VKYENSKQLDSINVLPEDLKVYASKYWKDR